jgi:hypothetical protein
MKLAFIMEKLAEEIEVDVDEAEINNMIASIAARQGRRFDRVRDELAKEGGIVNLYIQLRDEKLIAQLIEQADVTEEAPPAEKKKEKKAKPKLDDKPKPESKAKAKKPKAKKDDAKAEGKAPAKKKSAPKRTPPKAKKEGESDKK